MVKLSVIIVNFNSGYFLKKCLLSLASSAFTSKDYEIIIIDNNSKDSSLNEALTVKGLNLILLKNEENVGFAKANNQGINKSEGEYILLLNPDTILEKDTLNKMLRFMEGQKDVGVSTCKVELPNGTLDDACHRGFPTPWNAFCHFSGIGKLFPTSQILNGYHLGYRNMDKIHEIDSCVGAFMMIRRSAGIKVGWLDEDYFWYGEDIDFCYRMKEKGYKVMFVPSSKIVHYKGISSGLKNHSQKLSTANEETKKLATKSRFDVMRIFYKKHYEGKYPNFITNLVFLGIDLKRKFSL